MRALSAERNERNYTLLCSEIAQFVALCSIDNARFRLLKRLSPGPFVFILSTLHGTEKLLGLRRPEIGVRIPANPVPRAVIDTLGNPLYSITAKKSMVQATDYSWDDTEKMQGGCLAPIPEEALFEGGWELDAIANLDLILDSGEELERVFSTILDLTCDEVRIIRQGIGIFDS
jgi:tRNA A37 threonylcarbamoyladenosine synthetase subunit TsaC/SUA5/YrdC